MSLFQKHNQPKEYVLWRDWRVTLDGKYEQIDSDDSCQLINKDGSRVIYGSSFVINGPKDVKDELHYLDMEKEVEGSYHLGASVVQNNEALTIVVTFSDPLDESWARSVIESAHRVYI